MEMDIVLVVDNTSSMTADCIPIYEMILTLFTAMLERQDNVRIGVIKFRSCYDNWTIKKYGFTRNRTILKRYLYSDEPSGTAPDGCEAVGDALHEALQIEWRSDNCNQVPNKKMIILITDGAPDGLFKPLEGKDPWAISNQLKKQNISLVVVGVGNTILECDDFYCALAQNTGGAYIPQINAGRILSYVIQLAIDGIITFREAFRHVNIEDIEKNSSFKYSYMQNRVIAMISECKTMNDIRKFFPHRTSDI